ncbi:MAG: sugar transferase [Chakrabartia sp.]
MAGVRVMDVSAFIEREIGCIDLRWTRPAWLLRPQGFAARDFGAVVKRSLDLVLALCLLVSLAPLLAVVMMAIRIESPGPALFWQERVDQFGRRFWLVKLRSMGVHAEADGQARWAEEDDPRVTRLGRWLRQLHIDELPQLWNILRGEMSFAGPRPERPEFVIQLEAEIPYYAERHHLRPGITGWAQINYPYAASLQDARAKLEFDLFYVKHAHFLLDILILLQTARVLIWRTGAR